MYCSIRTEEAYVQCRRFLLTREPIDGRNEPIREHVDVEAEMARHVVDLLFTRGQEIDEQRREPRVAQYASDIAIA